MFLKGSGGILLIDEKENEDIREELHIADVITRIKDYQTKWWEHVERMEGQQILEILSMHNSAGKGDP